ncbi:hypothetical protein KKG83_02370 [Candidatus Micrarchaeota archaeon]|nr:hypothetical protein [Candidatus Micrarchaeota archaeon]MBU2476296.1 hypothetical protein [Candidatus Micrarchaeota archaeon]
MKKIFVLFLILIFSVLLFGCPEDSKDSNGSDKNAGDLNQLNDLNNLDLNIFDENVNDSNILDENICVEDWECDEWSECVNGEKTRDCWGNNECDLVNNLTEIRVCDLNNFDLNVVDENLTDLNVFDENGNCIENWECTEWDECVNGWEERTCIEQNNCEITELQPSLYQHCGECIHEETVDCVTDENCSGIQECISGEWGDCFDDPEDNCPGDCQNGHIKACVFQGHCPGIQTCSDHSWEYCVDAPYDNCPGECYLDQIRNCTTTENCAGTQTCLNYSWDSVCIDKPYDNCPLPCEGENKTEIELKEENLYYKDESAVQHILPFYDVSSILADDSTNTIVIDGQTIWYQIDIFDENQSYNRIITFRKNNSEGELINIWSYTDEAYNKTLFLEGANGITHEYQLMVDEFDSSTRVWLFLSAAFGESSILTQYNKYVMPNGTSINTEANVEYYFYLPHNSLLPESFGGGDSFDPEANFKAYFYFDEDGDKLYEVMAAVDTETGNVISGYYKETGYLGMPASINTLYGSIVELNNNNFKMTIPENSCS